MISPAATLKTVDVGLLAEAAVDAERPVTDAEAQVALDIIRNHGGESLSVEVIKAKATVGKFLTGHVAGHVQADSMRYLEIMHKNAIQLSRMMEDEGIDPRTKVRAAAAAAACASVAAQLFAAQLKSSEVSATKQTGHARNAIAPQLERERVLIQNNVTVGDPTKTVEVTEIKKD